MRRLIINADDLGVNSQRSHGIFQCVEFGVVSSVSVIPNGTDSDDGARHARERNVSAGLHLNLIDEYPLSKPEHVSSLIEANSMFLGKEKLLAAFAAGEIDPQHVDREVRAQFEWFLEVYGVPTHINSHGHTHLEPLVIDAIIPLMERYGVGFVRIPCEEPLPPFGYIVSDEQLARVAAINERAKKARDHYRAHGIGTTDHFRGLTLFGNASLKNMRHILGRLPEGTTELQVHPGSPIAYGTPFDLDPQRQTELRMLLDESIKKELVERKIELVSFGG